MTGMKKGKVTKILWTLLKVAFGLYIWIRIIKAIIKGEPGPISYLLLIGLAGILLIVLEILGVKGRTNWYR